MDDVGEMRVVTIVHGHSDQRVGGQPLHPTYAPTLERRTERRLFLAAVCSTVLLDRRYNRERAAAHQRSPPSSLTANPIANASMARLAGRARDHRPTVASHAAPRPQPTAKPTIGGQVFFARMRALATLSGSLASITSPTSIMKRVTLVVITAVDGAPVSEICGSVFCTAIADTPSMPARIAFAAFGSMCGPAATQRARKPPSSRNCSRSSGHREASPIAS